MDETFEEVDFSYIVSSSGKKQLVETLEILEDLKPALSNEQDFEEAAPQAKTVEAKTPLTEGQKDN